jgi:hypothetical protein
MEDETQNEHEHKGKYIKLDGSAGLTDRSILTIITKDPLEGEREETFEFPTALISMQTLNVALQYRFIKGYKLVQQDLPPTENGE